MKDYYQMIYSSHQFIYKGTSNSSTTDFKLSYFKREKRKLLWAKQGSKLLSPLLTCGESFSRVIFLHSFFSLLKYYIKPNNIVWGLRESHFPFCDFLLYILSGNRYVKNNSRIHTIPTNESSPASTGLWSTDDSKQINFLEDFSNIL